MHIYSCHTHAQIFFPPSHISYTQTQTQTTTDTHIFLPQANTYIPSSISLPRPSLHRGKQELRCIITILQVNSSSGSFRRPGIPRWSSASFHAFKRDSDGGGRRHISPHLQLIHVLPPHVFLGLNRVLSSYPR